MFSKIGRTSTGLRLMALLALVVLPGMASAQRWNVVVENKTTSAVVVQTSAISGVRVLRARPQVIQAKMTSAPVVFTSNQIVVMLYDPRVPARVIGRARFNAPLQGLKVALQPSPQGGILLKAAPLH